eukprot:1158699-Pelagomonas_calceolata.AAC.15
MADTYKSLLVSPCQHTDITKHTKIVLPSTYRKTVHPRRKILHLKRGGKQRGALATTSGARECTHDQTSYHQGNKDERSVKACHRRDQARSELAIKGTKQGQSLPLKQLITFKPFPKSKDKSTIRVCVGRDQAHHSFPCK